MEAPSNAMGPFQMESMRGSTRRVPMGPAGDRAMSWWSMACSDRTHWVWSTATITVPRASVSSVAMTIPANRPPGAVTRRDGKMPQRPEILPRKGSDTRSSSEMASRCSWK